MNLAQREKEFWRGYEICRAKEDASQEERIDAKERSASLVTSSTKRFQPYPFQTFKREDVRIVRMA